MLGRELFEISPYPQGMDPGQLKQASVTPGFRGLASSSSLPGDAYPDSLPDRMRRFAPQDCESRYCPPRLTWSRSRISKSGLYPAPCGARFRANARPRKSPLWIPAVDLLKEFLRRCILIHRPVRIQLDPVEFFNQRINRRTAPHAPGDEEEKDQGHGDEFGPIFHGRSPLAVTTILIPCVHAFTFMDSATRPAQP